MKVYDKVEQGTPEWHQLKLGKVTGTVAKAVNGTPVAYKTVLYEIVGERLSVDVDSDDPMGNGIELEPKARAEYERRTGNTVTTVGFTEREDCKWIGSSPDGLVESGGKYSVAVEIKCLGSKNHIKAIEENEIPKEYYWQVIQYFVVNDDLLRVDFVLYNPNLTRVPYHCIEVHRADVVDDIAESRKKQDEFIAEVNRIVDKYI